MSYRDQEHTAQTAGECIKSASRLYHMNVLLEPGIGTRYMSTNYVLGAAIFPSLNSSPSLNVINITFDWHSPIIIRSLAKKEPGDVV